MIYQQQMRYIQNRRLNTDPTTLFDSDLSKQIKEWRGEGERIVLVICVNGHPLYNNLYRQLRDQGTELEEFLHKCWGPIAPIHTSCQQITYRRNVYAPRGGDSEPLYADLCRESRGSPQPVFCYHDPCAPGRVPIQSMPAS
jgi:hypothetical protein